MGKAQFAQVFNWQSNDPRLTFQPIQANSSSGNSPKSGVSAGVMSGTSTIYSNILGIQQNDNYGITTSWSGTPTGTITYLISSDGVNFSSLTNSLVPNPSGTAAFYNYALRNCPFHYLMIEYVNASGTGSLTITSQQKANNQ